MILLGVSLLVWPVEPLIAKELDDLESLNECQLLEGIYSDSGTQLAGTNRGSLAPPTISRDVLLTWKPGTPTEFIAIRLLQKSQLRFAWLDINGTEVLSSDQNIVCKNGEARLEWSGGAGSEGFRGTAVTQVSLRTAVDGGALLVDVYRRVEGRDFWVFPRSYTERFEFRFERR
jgi:hypothetical protein